MEALRPSSDAANAITPAICPLSEEVGNHISRYRMIAKRLLKLFSAAAERAVRVHVDCTGCWCVRSVSIRTFPCSLDRNVGASIFHFREGDDRFKFTVGVRQGRPS